MSTRSNSVPSGKAHALYLHIPFCRHRCSYCDFNTYTTVGELQAPYVAALIEEIRRVGAAAPARPAVPTVFFGGGTPSLLAPEEVAAILGAAREAFDLSPEAEITLEANPETVDVDRLAGFRAAGVNRISYGVQSADAEELALLGREHDFATAIRAVEAAREAGFDNLNLDLIYGLPGQSVGDWQRTLDAVLASAATMPVVTHISLYCLTIEPGTPMQRWLHNGTIMAPDPDTAADQYEAACRAMAGAGFDHYEISNWARPGRECRHNLVYWRNEPYLGLGAGAHGLAGGYRYQVVRLPRAYIKRITNYELRITNEETAITNDELRMTNEETAITNDELRMTNEETAIANYELRMTNEETTITNDELRMTNEEGSSAPPHPRSPAPPLPVSPASPLPFPLSPAVAAHHPVDEAEAMSDTVITQLRLLNEGLDLDGFAARFGRAFDEVYGPQLRQLVDWELLRIDGPRLLLTEKGRFLSNQVFYRFV